MNHQKYIQVAYEEALLGLQSGGIPIGSVLVYQDKIIGRGHNQRIQKHSSRSSPIFAVNSH